MVENNLRENQNRTSESEPPDSTRAITHSLSFARHLLASEEVSDMMNLGYSTSLHLQKIEPTKQDSYSSWKPTNQKGDIRYIMQ